MRINKKKLGIKVGMGIILLAGLVGCGSVTKIKPSSKVTPTTISAPTPQILAKANFTFTVPNSWAVLVESTDQVVLAHWYQQGTDMQISFNLSATPASQTATSSPSVNDTSSPSATVTSSPTVSSSPSSNGVITTIGGDTVNVVNDWTGGAGTSDLGGITYTANVTNKASNYILSCVGYTGYDLQTLQSGCSDFAQSIAFKS